MNKLNIFGLISAMLFGAITSLFSESFYEFVIIYSLGALWSFTWVLRCRELEKRLGE